MKKLSITFTIILLVLGCFWLSSAVKADPRPTPPPRPLGGPIVGLWHVSLYLDPNHTQLFAETYKQWHSDRLEFESANLFPGAVCVGTWQQMASHMVSLYHVGWTPGGVPGLPNAVRFVETETDTVSVDGNSYDGTGTQTFYDQDGNPLAAIPLYIQATRLPPQ
jgi:hypothetical protein